MLLRPSSPPPQQAEPAIQWRSNPRYTVGWIGNVFCFGQKAGGPTIERLLEQLDRRPAAELLPDLNGVYGLFIYDHAARKWLVSTDNAGLYRIFYSTEAVSTRFLELAAATPPDRRPLDDQAIVEFIANGGNYGRHTPIGSIKKLRRGELLELQATASPAVRVIETSLEEQTEDAERYVLDYFDALAQAVSDQTVSVDLTGGFDSRLIVGLLARAGLPFECALLGSPDSREAAIAQTIATVLERKFYLNTPDVSVFEQQAMDVFRAGDGLTEMVGLFRDRQLCLQRLARGVELMVHGGGGEFFRDHWYVQDFPRYGVRRSDVAKFYNLRIAPITILDSQLTADAVAFRRAVAQQTIEKFAECRQKTNNKTYDRIVLNYKHPENFGAIFSNYLNLGMAVEAPYINFRMAMAASQLPPWSRAFQLWHRRIITTYCASIAEIKTVPGGYTASSRPTRILAELGIYAQVQLNRVAGKLSQRLIGKRLFYRQGNLAVDVPGYIDGLRRSALLDAAVARLQRQGILSAKFDKAKVADIHVGRIMTMGTLLRHLDQIEPSQGT